MILEPAEKARVWFAHSLPFFQKLSPLDQKKLEQRMVRKKYQKGEMVYSPLSSTSRVYFVVSGRVKVGVISPSGKELTVEILGPGDVFGRLPGSEDEDRTFARAVVVSELVSIEESDFSGAISKYPEICSFFVNLLSGKKETIQSRLEDIVFLDVKGRIAKLILELAEKEGVLKEGEKEVAFELGITHRDIAAMAATSRETATAVLSSLRKNKILEIERGKVRIYDINKLKRLIRY